MSSFFSVYLKGILKIPTAVQLNSEQLRPIFNWFANKLTIFNDLAPLSTQFSIEKLQKSEGKQAICNFLTTADISIADISIESRKINGPHFHFDLTAGKTTISQEEQEIEELLFHHVTEKGTAVFNLLFLILNFGYCSILNGLPAKLIMSQ